MTVSILTAGLREFERFVNSLPELATEAAYFAVNDTSRDVVPLLKRDIRAQINFPASYLNKDRLSVRRRATRATLESVISGRDRPTSLARFAEGATIANTGRKFKRPISVEVKTGQKTSLRGAFLIELRSGNLGLAIRLPKGQKPDRAYKPVELTRSGGQGQGAWLLYGPSVDQVLQGVIPEITNDVQGMLDRNFLRHLTRLTRG